MDGYYNFWGSSRKHKALTPWRHIGKPPPWWSSIRFPKTPWGWTLYCLTDFTGVNCPEKTNVLMNLQCNQPRQHGGNLLFVVPGTWLRTWYPVWQGDKNILRNFPAFWPEGPGTTFSSSAIVPSAKKVPALGVSAFQWFRNSGQSLQGWMSLIGQTETPQLLQLVYIYTVNKHWMLLGSIPKTRGKHFLQCLLKLKIKLCIVFFLTSLKIVR